MAALNYTNKRIFPRYKLNLNCDLIIAGTAVNAIITDYSIAGVGFIVKNISLLDSKYFNIKINQIDVDNNAKVIWSEHITSGLKIGIRKLEPLKGSLSSYRLSDILTGIQRTGKTGMLQIDINSLTKKIFFKHGDVIFSSSTQEDERLGKILINAGKINPYQFNKALELMRKTKKRLGTALLELGYLTMGELVWAVRYQVEKIILNLFKLEKGSFIFKGESLPIDEAIIMKLRTADIIYRGVKAIDNAEKIKKSGPPVDAILYSSLDSINLFQEVSFDADDKKIVSLIDGKRTVKDIVSISPVSEAETLKTIFALYNTQLIDVVGDAAADSLDERNDPHEPENSEIVHKIEKLHREYKSLGYYGVLGIDNNAAIHEIKHAYYNMVKEFHPDRHQNLLSDSLKDKLNIIFAYINEAYRVAVQHKNILHSDSNTNLNVKAKDDNKSLAKKRFDEGKGFFIQKNYGQAAILFGQAVYLDNTVPDYYYYYGIALFQSKKIKDAEEAIKKALQLDPDNSRYIAELGHIYLQLGFKIRAKSTFEKALKFNPSNKRAAEGLKNIIA